MQDPRAAYLESQVLTATPQKLRLMLIEGALRFLYRAEAGYDSEPIDRAMVSESLTRARNIVAELLSSVKDEEQGPNQQVASLYLFIFQQLTESQLRGDRAPLREITEILTVERETWRQLWREISRCARPGRNEKRAASGDCRHNACHSATSALAPSGQRRGECGHRVRRLLHRSLIGVAETNGFENQPRRSVRTRTLIVVPVPPCAPRR